MGEIVVKCIVVGLLGYLLGSFSPSYFISKFIKKTDLRSQGSGNLGSTNVMRVFGAKYAAITFVIDVLKGVAAVMIGELIFAMNGYSYSPVGILVSGVGVVLGHNFPFYLKFKGGKGIATTFGVCVYLNPFSAVLLLLLEWIVTFATGYVSLASIINCIAMPFMINMLWLGQNRSNIWYWVLTIVLAVIGLIKHYPNMVRLVKGKENRFSLVQSIKKKKTVFEDKDVDEERKD